MVWYHDCVCLLRQESLPYAYTNGTTMKITIKTPKTIPMMAPELKPVDVIVLPEKRGSTIFKVPAVKYSTLTTVSTRKGSSAVYMSLRGTKSIVSC